MQKKLALLCEKQLNSILVEGDVAFRTIVDAATTSIRLCRQGKHSEAGEVDQTVAIAGEMQKLLVSMQFHDEFSQRLRHVIELCRLIAEQDASTGANMEIETSLLEQVAGIFSVSSEFSVLQSIFPEYRHEQKDAAIELF
jgi:hypothetical protein